MWKFDLESFMNDDSLLDLISQMDNDSSEYENDSVDEYDGQEDSLSISSTADTSVSPDPAPFVAKNPRKRANFFYNLADWLAKSLLFLMAVEDSQFFIYEEDGGFYRPILLLEAYLVNLFDENIRRSLLTSDVRELIAQLSWKKEIHCSHEDFNQCPEIVNLKNGVFSFETGQLLNHAPHFRFTYQINAQYLKDPEDVVCPVFDEFCNSSLDGDADKRQLLLEFIGYICSDSSAGKCALFLKGQPNTGKSVISEFITRLFDPTLVSNVPLHQLGDRFFRAELARKKLNVAGEVAGRALRDISIFKSVTGNDRIEGEFKGQKPFSFIPRCKLLYSGNTLPQTTEADVTEAFANRLKVLLFNQSVPPEKQDKMLLDKLWKERDAIVTLSLHAYQELADRNFRFTIPVDSKLFLESFKLRGNILCNFLEECCVCEPKARVFNTELYAAFVAFCNRNGVDCISRKKFYDLLSGIPHVVAKRLRNGTENRQGHVGIRLKAPAIEDTVEPVSKALNTHQSQSSGNLQTHIIERRGL